MNLSLLPHELDKEKCECRVVVETPKGRRNKFDYDSDLEAFTRGGLLAEGLSFPFDFGFVPSTLGEDGDPLDVMVLMDEPAQVGCVPQVRLIGVIAAEQGENGKAITNDRLIGVSDSFSQRTTRAVENASRSPACTGPSKALKLVEQGIKRFKKQ